MFWRRQEPPAPTRPYRYWIFEPRESITVYELACAMKIADMAGGGLGNWFALDCDEQEKAMRESPARRHFRMDEAVSWE